MATESTPAAAKAVMVSACCADRRKRSACGASNPNSTPGIAVRTAAHAPRSTHAVQCFQQASNVIRTARQNGGLCKSTEDTSGLDAKSLRDGRPGQDLRHHLLRRGSLVDHGHDAFGDRHPRVDSSTERENRPARLHALRDHVHLSDDVVDAASLAELLADAAVA